MLAFSDRSRRVRAGTACPAAHTNNKGQATAWPLFLAADKLTSLEEDRSRALTVRIKIEYNFFKLYQILFQDN
jgi:hypothetical protein